MLEESYNRQIITSDEKVMTVYFMLEHCQKVNYQVFYNQFGATKRTFSRIISTLRRSLENAGIYEIQIFYNRVTQNYELVKAHFKM